MTEQLSTVLDSRGNKLDSGYARLRLARKSENRKIHNRPLGARPELLPGDVVLGLRGAYMLTHSKLSPDPTVAYFRMES